MSTRLTKKDFVIVYVILFIIASFISGFFLGAKVGKDKAEEEFNLLLGDNNPSKKKAADQLSYSHTDFSSYYYQIYLPFNEFRKAYLHFHNQMNTISKKDDAISASKEIQDEVEKVRKKLESTGVPNSSPLLQKSHKEYLSALQAYEKGLKQFIQISKSNGAGMKKMNSTLFTLPEFQKGRAYWLQGQTFFYESVLLWESVHVTKVAPSFISNPLEFTFDEYKKLRLHQKSELVAKILAEKKIQAYFNPEDVVAYLDSLTKSTKATQIKTIPDALEFLTASDSIQHGEFVRKISSYSSTKSPFIPLYSK
jgi:hypothetical protein